MIEGVPHPARNCAYLTFQYKSAKYSLHIPLYPSTAAISQSQPYATSIPKFKAMTYFKSIYHIRSVCICIEVQYLQTCSYTGNILSNLWKSKQCMSKLNSTYYELERQHNVHLHHTRPRKQITLLAIHPGHLFQRFKVCHYVPAVLLHRP